MKYKFIPLIIGSVFLQNEAIASPSKTDKYENAFKECQFLFSDVLDQEGEQKITAQVYINFARRMAKKSDHAAAILGFKMAMEVDPNRRLEILREYADQLALDWKAQEAIPLYQEVIKANLSSENTFLARLGLARSYFWTNQYDQAFQEYAIILGQDPKNDEAIKTKAQMYLNLARDAANKGEHQASVNWFKKAVETDPRKRLEILKEYADQLTYNYQGMEAIPLYQEVIQANLSPESNFQAQLALAKVFFWTNQYDQAFALYNIILSEDPKNAEAMQMIAQMYVNLARDAAGKGNHQTSVDWFKKAIETNPSKRLEWLREYADQLTYNYQGMEAIPLYQEVIQANLSRDNTLLARISLAKTYGWTYQYENALQEYQTVLKQAPRNYEALEGEKKTRAQIAIDFARKLANLGENGEALIWFKKAMDADPSRRLEILREYADQLSYSQPSNAIPYYLEIIQANPSSESVFFAHLGLARTYLSLEEYEKARSEYRIILSMDPTNAEALKGVEPIAKETKENRTKKLAEEEFQKGVLYEKKLEIFQARAAYKNSLCLDPTNENHQVQYAWFLNNYDFLEEAVEQFSVILPYYEDKRAIYQTLGWNLKALGNLGSSLRAFSRVYNFSCFCNTNNQFIKISRCQDAETRVKKIRLIHKILLLSDWGAIQFPTNNLDQWFCCSLLQGCSKDPCIKKMYQLCKNRKYIAYKNLDALMGICSPAPGENKIELMKQLLNIYSYTGEIEPARALAQILICIDPEDYRSYLLYINALLVQRKCRAAILEYLLLLKKLPNNGFLYFRLGEAYEKSGNNRCAKLSYEIALTFHNHPKVQSAYTRILAKMGCCKNACTFSEQIEESFLIKTLTLAEMNLRCGKYDPASCYYKNVLHYYPYNRCALFGLIKTAAYNRNVCDGHLSAYRISLLPFESWKEAKFFQYYRPPQFNLNIGYFKNKTKFSEFDVGLIYDFYATINYRLNTGFIYSNYKQLHFDRIDRYNAIFAIDKFFNDSEINLRVEDHYYRRINFPPDHITSAHLPMIMKVGALDFAPMVVPMDPIMPEERPELEAIKAIAFAPMTSSRKPFRHSKNSINYYLNFQHYCNNFNFSFGLSYYDIIDTTPTFGLKIYNYAQQYGAVALNIKTKDIYGNFFYYMNRLSISGNVVYGRYSLKNNKQTRWFGCSYRLWDLPELFLSYGYFFLNFTSAAPFFIENAYFEKAYYDPINFETHNGQLTLKYRPTNRLETKLMGGLYYTPKSNCIGKIVDLNLNYIWTQNYSCSLEFSYLEQQKTVGRNGILEGYYAYSAIVNMKYGF